MPKDMPIKIPPVEFLVEYVEDFNAYVAEGKYFYTDIVKEGIIIYNSGNYEIEPVRELNYTQIANLSKNSVLKQLPSTNKDRSNDYNDKKHPTLHFGCKIECY